MVTGADLATVIALEREHDDIGRLATRADERLKHGEWKGKTRTVIGWFTECENR
jgi:hypothetical protein